MSPRPSTKSSQIYMRNSTLNNKEKDEMFINDSLFELNENLRDIKIKTQKILSLYSNLTHCK